MEEAKPKEREREYGEKPKERRPSRENQMNVSSEGGDPFHNTEKIISSGNFNTS